MLPLLIGFLQLISDLWNLGVVDFLLILINCCPKLFVYKPAFFLFLSREFQGSSIIPFFSRLSPEGWVGIVTLVLAVLCTKLCAGKVRTVRFPKAYLFIMRDSDVRTVLSIWVSFSVSRIVFLYVLFRWLEKWDIAGSPITLACYCLSTCSPWPPPLVLV